MLSTNDPFIRLTPCLAHVRDVEADEIVAPSLRRMRSAHVHLAPNKQVTFNHREDQTLPAYPALFHVFLMQSQTLGLVETQFYP